MEDPPLRVSALRRRTVIVLFTLLTALVLSTGGLVWAEDNIQEISERETPCCWNMGPSPELPCYLCNDTRP